MARFFFYLVLSLSLLGAPAAFGQQTPATTETPAAPALDAKKQQAREHFFRGLQLAENDDWEGALLQFQKSIELFPTRVALKNAAITLQQLRRSTEAVEMYGRLLQTYAAELPDDDRRAAERSLEELKKRVGELSIATDPPGATVLIDGKERGVTPLRVRVDSGPHWLRIFREGYTPQDRELVVSGGRSERIGVQLERLVRSGRLRVAEASGRVLNVLVDGVVVGVTPWEGAVEAGTRSVALAGPARVGTAPSAATVVEKQLSTINLRAVLLDADVRIEPVPSNAQVHVDGVPVGSGIWEGALPSGSHSIEVSAPGFLTARRELRLGQGKKQRWRAKLDRDPKDPRWQLSPFRSLPFVEVVAGGLVAPGLGGGTARACARGACSEHGLTLGYLAGARAGYQFLGGFSVELFVGYFAATESARRTQTLKPETDFGIARADDFSDETRLGALGAALSASYRFFERTPLTARAWLGLLRASTNFETAGRFSGTVTERRYGETATYRTPVVRLAEDEKTAFIPFAGPELRFGYRFSPRFSMDAGAALLVLLAPSPERSGGRLGAGSTRKDFIDSAEGSFATQGPVGAPGTSELPRETALGTTWTIAPTLAARLDF